jgi:flagella basal body P-ring formation protein FlgA
VRITLALGLVAFLAGAVPVQAERPAVTVRLAPEVVVRSEEIALGDLGSIEGDPALARRLRQVKLGPSPLPGTSQQLSGEHLKLRLSDAQLEPARVQLIVPEHVLVTRAFQVLPGGAIVEAATRHARERLEARDASGGPYSVVAASRPEDMRIPTGQVELTARIQGEPTIQSMFGVTVTIKVDGRSFQTIPLSVRVGHLQSVLVATRALDPRSDIGPDDLRLEPRPSTEIPAGALATMPELVDLEMVRPVRAGEVLTPGMVRQRLVVHRGDVVTLVLEGRGFRITSKGLAIADARRGEALRVVNPSSKRESLGRVEGPGLVRVPFGETGNEP